MGSLEREAARSPGTAAEPSAIIVLGGDGALGADGPEIGPLTLERLRAGAALHRRTGLPLLVTGGPLSKGATPIAKLMAESLEADFGVAVRWVEAEAPDTRGNAEYSVGLLRSSGIGSAYLVSHGWHLPRAAEAFARLGFPVSLSPIRVSPLPPGRLTDWIPRTDHLAWSWYGIREYAGRLVYRLRDGTAEGRRNVLHTAEDGRKIH
nr:YdcF family protein [Pararoseomonas baculiformis]